MTEPTTISIEEGRFAALIDMRERTTEALAQWNTAKDTAKDKHKAYESARETFEREFDRLVKSARGEDLPLFTNQSEALEAAQSDPVVTKLVERLLARGHDVNLLIVAGYTETERAQVAEYLDAMDRNDDALERVAGGSDAVTLEAIPAPAFLTPQPLTALEIADLVGRLTAAGAGGDDLVGLISTWSQAEIAEVRHWLTECERIKGQLGEAVTVDDLPTMPDCLVSINVAD